MIMMMIMMMISMLFPLMKHPLSMGFLLIIQTMMTALITGIMYNNSFFMSYILFITMMSGALVLFIYMASVASNEKFKSSMTMLIFVMMWMLLIIIIMYNNDDEIIINMNQYNTSQLFMNYNQSIIMNKMFNTQFMMITIMLVIYLLFTMISVTFMVNVFEGPMRKKS
uniref:NADH-ubiquinone oxidoreductase chain 6 n=1 Tax=Himacerus apterus TaxID=347976 RepID=K7NB92_9HEMI|nr:NADH dehydrogenase subunit 6 [Himacerus apterus]